MSRPQHTNTPGWPRPYRTLDDASRYAYERNGRRAPERVPAPWVNQTSEDNQTVDWYACEADACAAIHHERRCQMCGEVAAGSLLLPLGYVPRENLLGGMHPRCLALTLTFCPHFALEADAVVAYAYHAAGQGYVVAPDEDDDPFSTGNPVVAAAVAVTRAEVGRIAAVDPLGTQPERWPVLAAAASSTPA